MDGMAWAALFTAIQAIVIAWFKISQKSTQKKLDLKLRMMEQEEKRKVKIRHNNVNRIFGEIWELLHFLKADRVYILQPYPLDHTHYITIEYEVKRKGIVGMKESVQKMPISEIAVFARDIADNDFLFFPDVESNVNDKRTRALLTLNGGASEAIKRMTDDRHDWNGSIVVEYVNKTDMDQAEIKKMLDKAAMTIQYILPEYMDNNI